MFSVENRSPPAFAVLEDGVAIATSYSEDNARRIVGALAFRSSNSQAERIAVLEAELTHHKLALDKAGYSLQEATKEIQDLQQRNRNQERTINRLHTEIGQLKTDLAAELRISKPCQDLKDQLELAQKENARLTTLADQLHDRIYHASTYLTGENLGQPKGTSHAHHP